MAEETQVVETQEIPLDQVTDMREYKKAREEGKETVTKEAPAEKKEESKSEDKPKAKGGFQARIDRLVKQAATLEEQLAVERKARAEESKTKEVPKTEQATTGEPQRDEFQSDMDYYRALTRWEVKQEMKSEKEAEAKEAAAAATKEKYKSYNQRMIALQAENEEYKELMNQDISIPTVLETPLTLEMENGADVVIYLAKNPELCEQMLKMPPSKAIAEAWKISEKLARGKDEADEETEEKEEEQEEKEAVEEEKPKKKAPAPIKPISGGASRSTVSLDKSDFQAYKKLRAQGRAH